MKPLRSIKLALPALLVFSAAGHAATWAVDSTADTPVGQACPGFTGCSLREAVTSTELNAGPDAILVGAGTYLLTNGQLDVTQNLTVARVGAGAVTIDAGLTSRIFDITGSQFILRFITLINGRHVAGLAEGGAIRGGAGTTISIESSTLRDNIAEGATTARGGAIATQGNLSIGTASGSQTGSTLIQNTARATAALGAAEGGAVWVGGPGTLTIGARSVLNSNDASAPSGTASGGAVRVLSSSVTATQTTMFDNAASGATARGGGIAAQSALLARSTLSSNSAVATTAAQGGAVWISAGGQVTTAFSTITDNLAEAQAGGNARGGALFAPTMTLGNTTIIANRANVTGAGDARGGGIAGTPTTSFFDIFGSIVSGNLQSSGSNCDGGTFSSRGYSLLAASADCGYTAGPGDIVSSTPNVQPLASNGGLTQTMAVFQDSAAYDAIPAAATQCISDGTDQRGIARPQHGNCEIGAYEGRVATDIGVTMSDGVTSVVSGSSATYTVTVSHNSEVPLIGATLVDPVATGLAKTGVTCVLPAGCTAPAIAQLEAGYTLPMLLSGQVYRLTITAQVTAAGGAVVTNTATAALPPDLVDGTPANNSVSDTDDVLADGIFANGFEN